jgi:Asp-tRNA(Asn)/Glu-tRNA(Gln) amidotransferase A subunit family amidase
MSMPHDSNESRRRFMAYFSTIGLGSTLFPGVLFALSQKKSIEKSGAKSGEEMPTEMLAEVAHADDPVITVAMIEQAEKMVGVSFTPSEREMMVQDLNDALRDYEKLRAFPLPNSVSPALIFNPDVRGRLPLNTERSSVINLLAGQVRKPSTDTDLAFTSVKQLSGLLRRREIKSVDLTQMYLRRLKQFDPQLAAVISYTEERAMDQARKADQELDRKSWRGWLHGIPWGAKDLLAVKGTKTTWGSVPFKEQRLEYDAAVVERLDAAGAVLIAKLTMGELAWGDVWFGGKTKCPWNPEIGASGSSAGVGATVPAGLVGFGIGTETLGSIVAPSNRNGCTGLRPTFGRVSRHGAMALSWSMDKIGAMARSAEDCALIFSYMHGRDVRDLATRDASFVFPMDVKNLRIGYVPADFEKASEADKNVLAVLKQKGIVPKAVSMPDGYLPNILTNVIDMESAAAFDEITRNHAIDTMVRQTKDAWPHVFRKSRLLPAVEYIQMNRIRTQLMLAMDDLFQSIDVLLTPSFAGDVLSITNLTGHPCVTVPNEFALIKDKPDSPYRTPNSFSFIGSLYQEAAALSVAKVFQDATDFHKQRPPIGR